jgi:hypothetical protein
MVHTHRVFCVGDVEDDVELAKKLTEHTWTLCTGFRHKGYLYLNDSFGEDGAAEYAIVREKDRVQVESITFGWCKLDQALQYIRDISADVYQECYGTALNVLEGKEHHCHACA